MAQEIIGIGTIPNDGTGDTLRVSGEKINNNMTSLFSQQGWALYTDSLKTIGSPLVINQGTTATLTNNSNTFIDSFLPLGTVSLYNSATNKITPESVGDYYILTVRFKAKNTNVNGYFDFGIDLSGALGVQFMETLTFVKGANTEQNFAIVIPMYSLETFVSNGGIPKITSDVGDTSIYNISYQITRIYKNI